MTEQALSAVLCHLSFLRLLPGSNASALLAEESRVVTFGTSHSHIWYFSLINPSPSGEWTHTCFSWIICQCYPGRSLFLPQYDELSLLEMHLFRRRSDILLLPHEMARFKHQHDNFPLSPGRFPQLKQLQAIVDEKRPAHARICPPVLCPRGLRITLRTSHCCQKGPHQQPSQSSDIAMAFAVATAALRSTMSLS